jgi:serine/threonine-protein kinase
MGTVWLANHNKLRTEVVVKFLSEQLASDEDACARFEREVHATLQVRSPHVVQTLDHGITDGGIPYLVMEWLEGNDLAKEMRARQQLPADEVMHVMEGLAAALTKAHERGIVHRDIKPANVFLVTGSPRPFVKLVDFGIAKRLEDETMTATNALLGTPAYMSPEQMDGVQTVDHRTDLWALGVLAFHMLTGNPPFRGSHIAHIAHAIMHGERPKISTARPDLPPALDAWVERALARDPMHRFASARELVDTLGMAFGEMVYTTNRRAAILALGTGPHGPPSSVRGMPIGPSQPGLNSSVPIPVYLSSTNLTTSTSMSSLDVVGATLGPTANTQSPYGRRPLKWWVIGVAVVGVILVGLSFKVGYGLRPSAATQPTDLWNTPPPPPVTNTTPTYVQPVVTAPPPIVTTAPPPAVLTPPPAPQPQPVAKPMPAPKPVVAPHRAPAPRPSPGPKPKDPADDVGF